MTKEYTKIFLYCNWFPRIAYCCGHPFSFRKGVFVSLITLRIVLGDLCGASLWVRPNRGQLPSRNQNRSFYISKLHSIVGYPGTQWWLPISFHWSYRNQPTTDIRPQRPFMLVVVSVSYLSILYLINFISTCLCLRIFLWPDLRFYLHSHFPNPSQLLTIFWNCVGPSSKLGFPENYLTRFPKIGIRSAWTPFHLTLGYVREGLHEPTIGNIFYTPFRPKFLSS